MNKNSIVFYKDWWEAIKALPSDLRLKVYDAVCEYAFEGKDPEDAILSGITALMRSAIDRDKERYEAVCERNRENIKKRWSKKIQPNTTEYDRIRMDTKNTDNDINIEEVREIEDREEKEKNKSIDLLKKKKNPEWQFVRNYAVDQLKQTEEFARRFFDNYEALGWNDEQGNPIESWTAMMKAWARKEPKPVPQGVRLGCDEYINEKGQRTYGTGTIIIPMDAMPRPNSKSYWNAINKQWAS